MMNQTAPFWIGSTRVRVLFKDYSSFHKTRGNKMTHYLGIPLIVLSIFGLLSQWVWSSGVYFRLDAGSLLWIFGFIFYLYLDWKLAVPFSFVLAGFYFLGRALSMEANGLCFLIGWCLQGLGHGIYEKKAPAFSKNLTHLLVGPLWIFARIVGYS